MLALGGTEPALSRRQILLLAVVLASSAIRLYLALGPLDRVDGITVPDDAYLSLTIAKNMAAGLGPLYGEEATNGFQPLYVLLMVPVYLAFPDDLVAPVHIALCLLTLFDALTLCLLVRILAANGAGYGARLVAALAWALNPYVISNSMNGLETAIAVFFMVAALHWFQLRFQNTHASRGAGFLLGLLLGSAVLARIDQAILVLVIGLTLALQSQRHRRPLAWLVRDLACIAGGFLLIYGPWAVYSYVHTGALYPVSGKAVRFMSLANVKHQPTLSNWYWPMVRSGLWVVATRNVAYLSVTAAALAWLYCIRRHVVKGFELKRTRVLAVPISFAAILFFSYALYILTPWFFERYLYPISVALFLTMALAVDALFRNTKDKSQRIAAALILLLLVSLNFATGLPRIFAPTDLRTRGYMNLGLWARQNFENGTVLGCSQTGALGYFANNLRVVNLDGVVNERCLQSLVARRNMDYIRECGIQYVLGWTVNLQFIEDHSADYQSDDLVIVRKIEEFKSWNTDWYLARVEY